MPASIKIVQRTSVDMKSVSVSSNFTRVRAARTIDDAQLESVQASVSSTRT